MKKLFALLFVLSGCFVQVEKNSDAEEKINTLMREQEIAWNQGNFDAFMTSYWNNDSLLFIGKNGVQMGWQKTLDNYKKSYGNKSDLGRLKFENLDFKSIDKENAWVLGKWTLFRTSDTLSGHYTLLWQRKNGQWLIVADHSS